MPNEMFGAPTGQSLAEADNRANALAQLTLDQGSVKLEEAKLSLASQKQMLSMMSQPQASQPGQPPGALSASPQSFDLASQLDRFAVMAMASGLPDKAREYAVAGSTLRNQTSEIAARDLKAQITHLNLIGSLMSGVTDERSWQQANAMYKLQTGQETPYAKLPYNPQVVQELQMGAATAKDRALAKAAEARQAASKAATDEREARLPLIKAQVKLAEARTAKLTKAGAVTLLPKAGDIKAITDLIVKDYGAGVMPEDARVLARPVAEDMMKLMKDNALTPSQAANQAYQTAKASGAFGGMRPRPQMSGTPEKPLDLPADYSKLKVNMFYKGKGAYANKVLLWDGSSFKPVGNGPGEIKPVASDEDEVVSEEGEEGESSENPDDDIPAVEP